MGTVLLIPPKSRYGVLTEFTCGLHGGLRELGVSAELFQPGDEDYLHALHRELGRADVTHVIGFNALALNELRVRPFSKIHYIAWLADHPATHYPRLAEKTIDCSVISANSGDSAYLQEICEANYAYAEFPGFHSVAGHSTRRHRDRPYEITVAASWMGPPQAFWKEIQNESVKAAVRESLEELTQDEALDFYPSLKKMFSLKGIDVRLNRRLFSYYLNEIVKYIRRASRIKLVEALAESGRPVLLVGEGWAEAKSAKNFKFHASLNSNELVDLYSRSQVVINLNAKTGASERVIYGVQAGCVVLTHGTPELRGLFSGSESGVFMKDNSTASEIAYSLEEAVDRSASDRMRNGVRDPSFSALEWREKARKLRLRFGI